jgi:pimeloyl-ACP methyl ester carboxylesterase
MPKHEILLAAAVAGTLLAGAVQPGQASGETASITQTQEGKAMTQPTETSTLKVPGATIYYELWGSGPLLLIIAGGPQDAGVFTAVARQLADRYTVVAYDPRGNSRSPLDGAVEALSLDVQADDAAALIKTLSNGPAYVFGTSGGAQIGLNLATRYPELVQAIVAHEPPTMMLMDDPSKEVASANGLHETYKRDGVDAAMGQFFADNSLSVGKGEEQAPPEFDMPPEEMETFGRVSGNFECWLAHGMLPLSFYTPEVETLRTGKPRVVVAIGELSAGQPIDAMATALADKLGTARVQFPGDHFGFQSQAEPFAAALDRAFK